MADPPGQVALAADLVLELVPRCHHRAVLGGGCGRDDGSPSAADGHARPARGSASGPRPGRSRWGRCPGCGERRTRAPQRRRRCRARQRRLPQRRRVGTSSGMSAWGKRSGGSESRISDRTPDNLSVADRHRTPPVPTRSTDEPDGRPCANLVDTVPQPSLSSQTSAIQAPARDVEATMPANRSLLARALPVATAAAVCLGLATGAVGVGATAAAPSSQPWLNRHQSPARRANELLKAMTLADEVHMLHGVDTSASPVPTVGYIAPIKRLHVPAITMTDGPAGVRNGQKSHRDAGADRGGGQLGHRDGEAVRHASSAATPATSARTRSSGPGMNIDRVAAQRAQLRVLQRGPGAVGHDQRRGRPRHPAAGHDRDDQALRREQSGDEPDVDLRQRERPHAARDL